MPSVPAAGVPLNVPVPFPLSANIRFAGRGTPPIVTVGAGTPLVVTVNDPATPVVNVALFALVMAGPWLTVRVNVCVASGRTPLAAVIVRVYTPVVPGSGVPLNVAVPLPLLVKPTPAGRAPMAVIVGSGKPVVVIVNVPALPTVKVVAFRW